MTKINKNNKGFTLIELVVVIAIIAILAAILIPSLLAYLDKVKLREADSNAKDIYSASTAAYAQLQSIGAACDDASVKTAALEHLGDEYIADNITITIAATGGVAQVDWCDEKYWSSYTSNGKIIHGKGDTVGTGMVS